MQFLGREPNELKPSDPLLQCEYYLSILRAPKAAAE
jgi:hypothetical protein